MAVFLLRCKNDWPAPGDVTRLVINASKVLVARDAAATEYGDMWLNSELTTCEEVAGNQCDVLAVERAT